MPKIRVNIILEILGRPKEHVKTALNSLVAQMGSQPGMKVLDKTIHEPIEVKEAKDLFTSFAEVSLELDTIEHYLNMLFTYMPAHVELVSPAEIMLTNLDFNDLGNKLVARLHDYDAITKRVLMERNFILEELQKSAPDLFKKFVPKLPQPSAPQTAENEKQKKTGKKSVKKIKSEKKPKKD